jgi:PAS domain-containing protein
MSQRAQRAPARGVWGARRRPRPHRGLRTRTARASLALAGLVAAGAGCVGVVGDPRGDVPAPAAATLEEPVLPRLTGAQYRNALADLFQGALPATPVQPDTNPFLFTSIGATTDPLSELGVQQLEEAANAVAHAVFDDPARRAALVGCEPAAPGDACVEGFLRSFGRRAFRRTLGAGELAKWVAISSELADGDAWTGVRTAVAGMLQAPSFVYRVELGEPDPDDPSRLRYTGFEMASRLAFLLWDAPPDDALLDAAESGDLLDEVGLEVQARRLLDAPRARAATLAFFAQYLDLGRLDGITRDAALYPTFTQALAGAMRTEAELVVDDLVFRRDVDVRQLFSTRRTFVNDALASLYGVEAAGASAAAFVPVDLPEDGHRAGLLTLGAFLTMNAHEASTSPTLRGKYVRERVLCAEVPPPPPDVDTDIDPDPTAPPKTLRERLEQHRKNPACAGCHSIVDPPGFLFENFDAMGAFRTEDNGYPVDTSGDLDGVPLANGRELADLLATDPRVGRCMVKQLFRHSMGRLDAPGERPAIEAIHARFEGSGFRFRELVVALVTHESFRFVAPFQAGSQASPRKVSQ